MMCLELTTDSTWISLSSNSLYLGLRKAIFIILTAISLTGFVFSSVP